MTVKSLLLVESDLPNFVSFPFFAYFVNCSPKQKN